MKIIWGIKAVDSYIEELDFVLKKWNKKEVEKFVLLVESNLKDLASGLLEGKILTSKSNNLRKLNISKQTTLFFDVSQDLQRIELLLFWNNQKSPSRLKQIMKGFKKQ